MRSDNNHIDNFLRQKAGEASIDTSRMEADWQEMKTMLAIPGIVPASQPKPSLRIKKYFSYAAGVVMIVTITTLITPVSKKNAKKTAATAAISNKLKRTIPIAYTTPPQQRVATKPQLPSKVKTGIPRKGNYVSDVVAASYAKKRTKAGPLPIKPNSKTVFNNFYDELKKISQEFVINTLYDTTLRCKEGTSLFVPAGCFQSLAGAVITGEVKIYIQEFYSFADIISNKLSTTSNGMPLETGGMLNITAFAKNEEVTVRPGAGLGLKMPTRLFNPNMQLFVAEKPNATIMDTIRRSLPGAFSTEVLDNAVRTKFDTVSSKALMSRFAGSGVNWLPMGQQQFFSNENKRITVLDLRDDPTLVRTSGKKTIAKFLIPYYCKLTTTEVQKLLEKRYSKYYDIIKVKREWKPILKKNRIESVNDWYSPVSMVGDSISIPLNLASRFKLISREDSIMYEMQFRGQYEEAVKLKKSYSEFLQKKDEYNFTITNLGWINCDRFSSYPDTRLTDLLLNPGEGFEGTYFNAMLILEEERSAMPGYWNEGKVSFQNLPVGHVVNVICTGVKDGKMYSSVQKVVVEKYKNPVLSFEETSPAQFREKLLQFGNVKFNR